MVSPMCFGISPLPRRSRLPGAMLWGALMLLPWPVRAEVSEALQYRYYTVTSREGEALWQALDRASPIREKGQVFRGDTRWEVLWDLRWEQAPNGRCALSSVQTRLRATITLPQLGSGWDASSRARFVRYVTALRRHELGHVDTGREAARAIDRQLSAFPAMPSCDALKHAANAAGFELLEQARLRDQAYDRQTAHGRSEGVILSD